MKRTFEIHLRISIANWVKFATRSRTHTYRVTYHMVENANLYKFQEIEFYKLYIVTWINSRYLDFDFYKLAVFELSTKSYWCWFQAFVCLDMENSITYSSI